MTNVEGLAPEALLSNVSKRYVQTIGLVTRGRLVSLAERSQQRLRPSFLLTQCTPARKTRGSSRLQSR